MLKENEIYLGDCIDLMRDISDKSIDCIITDPPYGIGASSKKFINGTSKTIKDYYEDVCWDTQTPSKEYFTEIFRISKNQIIWGGNYFIEHLSNTRCFIIWDKTIHGNSYADCELAWTSFDKVARIKPINMVEANMDGRCHPTQKPLKLMKWCIEKFTNENDIILDPFLGSGTTAIACYDLKRRYIGIEKYERYFNIAKKRIDEFKAQGKLF